MTRKILTRFISLALSLCLIFGLFIQPAYAMTDNSETDNYETDTIDDDEALIEKAASGSFSVVNMPYKPVSFTANAPSFTLKADLSNVANLKQFSKLTKAQRQAIAKNGFVVVPTKEEQLFYIYEHNNYSNVPSFITVDSVLQVYHILFDYVLRETENKYMYQQAADLTYNMLSKLIAQHSTLTNSKVQKESIKVIAYFGTALLNLGKKLPEGIPADAKKLVDAERKLIEKAAGVDVSPIMGVKVDYSQFTARGHYTRTQTLKLYFAGMMWYGIVPFQLTDEKGKFNETATLDALIVTAALSSLSADKGVNLWDNIYGPTCFLVGASDDLGPAEYAPILEKVYGKNPSPDTLGDKLDKFYAEAKKLPKPAITPEKSALVTEFRFMGQRYLPDSEIMQKLTKDVKRPFASGLDVFAALGSSRAKDIIKTVLKPASKWPDYDTEFKKVADKFGKLSDSTWQSNAYYAWLWTLKAVTQVFGKGYPPFMQKQAWLDKSLSTALGSWSELRHDTILYGKSVAAEGDGDEDIPVVKGYVEPNVEAYNRLLWMTRYTRSNLKARKLIDETLEENISRFEDLLSFLITCSVKELKGQGLSASEYQRLRYYGGELEWLTLDFVDSNTGYGLSHWSEIQSSTDRHMAVIADVASYSSSYLEVGVGSAAEIFVVVSVDKKLYITSGAVFDYYEFVSGTRLTDEAWQKMLKDNKAVRPSWVNTFMVK